MVTWPGKNEGDKKYLLAALVAFMVMIAINAVAGSTTLIGGIQTADVSDLYKNLFTPAGFTFSIWGVIYLLLAAFLLRAFAVIKPKKPIIKSGTLNQLLVLFAISSALNAAWLVAWHTQVLWLSVVIMIGLLVTLTRTVLLLSKEQMSLGEYAIVRVPFSVYLGWISVATIANIAAWLVSINWDGFGIAETTWMILLLVIAASIAVIKGLLRRDPFFVMVFVWAFFGILYSHLSAEGYGGEHQSVIITIAILLPVLIMTALQLLREYEYMLTVQKKK